MDDPTRPWEYSEWWAAQRAALVGEDDANLPPLVEGEEVFVLVKRSMSYLFSAVVLPAAPVGHLFLTASFQGTPVDLEAPAGERKHWVELYIRVRDRKRLISVVLPSHNGRKLTRYIVVEVDKAEADELPLAENQRWFSHNSLEDVGCSGRCSAELMTLFGVAQMHGMLFG